MDQGRRKVLAHDRRALIRARLGADGSVAIAELAALLDVSRETIRRDLKELAQLGEASLIHGGAALFAASEPALDTRIVQNAEGKAAIGRAAASLVEDGMVVLIDSGTTAFAVAEALTHKNTLTVCTPALTVALRFCALHGFQVYMLGGEVDPREQAVTGPDAMDALRRLRVDLAFIGTGGLSPSGDVTDFNRSGAEQRARMVEAASAAWFVAGHEKFGRMTPMRVAGSENAGLIVDRAPATGVVATLTRRQQKLIVAEM